MLIANHILPSQYIWLVVWNMNFIFPYIGNNQPNWRTHIFQRGSYTTNQIMWIQLARDWWIQCRLWLCAFQHFPTGFLGMMVPTYFSIAFLCLNVFGVILYRYVTIIYMMSYISKYVYWQLYVLYIYILHVCIYMCVYIHISTYSVLKLERSWRWPLFSKVAPRPVA